MPRVTAVLVVSDGEGWLPVVLQALEAQDYPDLRIVAVDNGSRDGSHALLARHIDADRLITLNRSAGFGRALHAALRSGAVGDADYLLLVHDDLALAPDAVRLLVAAAESDPSVAITGPKLREWGQEPVLQEVGMTVDRFGRAENRVERGELDQGHRDARRDVLYVSTAGMLIRVAAYEELGGFDERFPALRDDLDLCWRAWLLGWRVEIVPDAVGYHAAAGSRGLRRLWIRRPWQARFLSERHALACLIKNYGWRRLAWALPVAVLMGLAKTLGFALTRRFSHVGATLRAYLWNVYVLPETLRRRRQVQRSRRRSDADLGPLFATGLPRVRDYSDAIRDWLSGSNPPAILAEAEERSTVRGGNRVVRLVRTRPVLAVGTALAACYLVGLLPLLGPGQLLGGDVLPWPASGTDFFRSYANASAGDPLAGGGTASPIQVVLGALDVVTLGSAWAAQRLAVFGLLPLAWLTALRAGRLVTSRRGPRVLGATLYALSPVALGTMAAGRVGEAAVAALLPAIVLLTSRAASPRAPRGVAWRATAWLALAVALAVASAPGLWLAVVPVLGGGLVVAARSAASARLRPLARLSTAIAGALGLLVPWLWTLRETGLPTAGPTAVDPLPAWRALGLAPDTLAVMNGGGVWLALTATVAILTLALLLGLRLRPLPVASLVGLLVLSAAIAWAAGRLGTAWVWPPALLLPGAAALAGLGALAARMLQPALQTRTFGLHQLAVLACTVPIVVVVAMLTAVLLRGPWDAYQRDVELVPPYVTAETERLGPYRVLVVSGAGADGEVGWSVNEATGPSMLEFGTVRSAVLTGAIEDALTRIMAGDLDGGAQLGLTNVRYVVLAGQAPELREALAAQPEVEPLVAGGGRVFLVRSWLPRAAVLPPADAEPLRTTGRAGDLSVHELAGLGRTHPGRYEGTHTGETATLLLSEEPGLWRATADGAELAPLDVAAGSPLAAFAVPPGADEVTAQPSGASGRAVALAFQALVFLGLVSLLLRPPGSGRPAVGRAASARAAPPPLEETAGKARPATVDAVPEGDR